MRVASDSIRAVIGLLQQGNQAAAIDCCRKLTTRHPNDPEPWGLLGHILCLGPSPEQARKPLRRALRLNPLHWQSLVNLGRLERIDGRADQAVELLQRASKLRETPEVINDLGLALRDLGRGEETISLWQRALQRGFHPGLTLNLANLHRDRNEYQAAIQHYRQLLEHDRNQLPAWNNLGLALQAVGELQDAAAAFEAALALAPDHVPVLDNLARCQLACGDLDAAQRHWERCRELAPDDPSPHVALGNLLRERGRVDAAIKCFHAAIARPHDDPACHCDLVALLEEQNRLGEAEDALDAAVACCGEHTELTLCRARLLRRRGNLNGAREALASIQPTSPDVERRRQFELGQVLDRLGDHAGASQAFERRARLRREEGPIPADNRYDQLLDRLPSHPPQGP